MGTLDWLFKLHLITKENDVFRGARHRDCIRERNLTCLVDEKEIQGIFPFWPAQRWSVIRRHWQ
jgi:hypothetical protein